jgi:membrane-associated phospholipid phosphatase
MTALNRWLISSAAAASSITISYWWFDRPVALLVHAQFQYHKAFERLTYIPDPFMPLAVITFVGLGLWALSGRSLSKIQEAALVCSISLLMAEAIKNQLKFIFGRTWPDTWVENIPSFIRDGTYGFNLFHGGAGYASFPSGHAAVTCAVISVLWIIYPTLRAIYLILILGVVVGLVGANYHFLSDVIAGAFVGISSGWMATKLWSARVSNKGPASHPARPPQTTAKPLSAPGVRGQ